MGKKRQDKSSTGGQGSFGSSLGDALKLAGFQPSATSAPEPASDKDDGLERALPWWKKCPKVHLRMERKGRGGKTVTLMGGLQDLSEKERKDLAKKVGKALGCGAGVEGEEVVVQGDQRDRLSAFLDEEKGSF